MRGATIGGQGCVPLHFLKGGDASFLSRHTCMHKKCILVRFSALDCAGGAYSALRDPLARLMGPVSKGMGDEGIEMG